MKRLRVTAVSYLNTKPFLYGLFQSKLDEFIDLKLDIPSRCAEKLVKDEADLGLVPVGALPGLANPHILSDYCIGCDGPVRTVCIYSDKPIEEVEKLYLDYHSRTSVLLTQVLLEHYWKVSPEILNSGPGFETEIKGTTAGLVIGDRTIGLEQKHPYIYDLGIIWKEFTGLPFVFAVWVSNKPLSEGFIDRLNYGLSLGLESIPQLLCLIPNPNPDFDLRAYFHDNISYGLDDSKLEALQLFYKYLGLDMGHLNLDYAQMSEKEHLILKSINRI